MNTIETLATFFGWMTVINVGLFLLVFIALATMRNVIMKIHSKMFGINESELPIIYFKFLAFEKLAILFLNLVPYMALKVMS